MTNNYNDIGALIAQVASGNIKSLHAVEELTKQMTNSNVGTYQPKKEEINLYLDRVHTAITKCYNVINKE